MSHLKLALSDLVQAEDQMHSISAACEYGMEEDISVAYDMVCNHESEVVWLLQHPEECVLKH